MEEVYSLSPVISGTNELVGVENMNRNVVPSIFQNNSASDQNGMRFRFEKEIMESDMSDLIKTQIANHPRYPDLVSVYIECQKVLCGTFFSLFLYINPFRYYLIVFILC